MLTKLLLKLAIWFTDRVVALQGWAVEFERSRVTKRIKYLRDKQKGWKYLEAKCVENYDTLEDEIELLNGNY